MPADPLRSEELNDHYPLATPADRTSVSINLLARIPPGPMSRPLQTACEDEQ